MAAENTPPAMHTPAIPSMWDLDELERMPTPPLGRRALRASAVAAAWGLAILPVAMGWQRCAVAMLLHRPCPGCGMTRAILLLVGGHVEASLRMHALAVPALLMGVFLMLATVWTTLVLGTPLIPYRGLLGRMVLAGMALVYGATLVLWIARCFGYFGGPVPVY
ncbi:MAG TPA: DUF2752 domain-containing protein [Polyangiaceae bacterium]|jgi:hypothetical protein